MNRAMFLTYSIGQERGTSRRGEGAPGQPFIVILHWRGFVQFVIEHIDNYAYA
jgi:hypothetical protein